MTYFIVPFIQKLVQKLPTGGAVAEGPGFIYPLWKAQIDRWFNLGMTTYLVTPRMDARRLSDVILLVCKHSLRRSNFSAKLIVKEWAGDRKRNYQNEDSVINDNLETSHADDYEDIKNCALNIVRDTKCVEDDVLEGVFKRLKVVTDLRFNGSFICAYKDTNAEILVTSAEFRSAHFETPVRDTVVFHKITKHELKKDYLQTFLSGSEQ